MPFVTPRASLSTLLQHVLAFGLALVVSPHAASAQPPPSGDGAAEAQRIAELKQRAWDVRAARVERGVIKVDGALSEEAWSRAEPVTEFFQRERRRQGQPATERTEVRVLHDDLNLYVGFRCFDTHPDLVKARSIFRDEAVGSDDAVAIMLDAYNDDRSAIQFATNYNGLMEDLLQTGETERTRNGNFDIVWNSRGRRIAEGYEVEVMIPFKSLRFDPPHGGHETVFGIGFKRNIPRKNEEMVWPFVSNDSSWYRPAALGDLRGLEGIRPGRSLELRPYALGGVMRDFAELDADSRHGAGLDVKWGVRTGLTADFTAHTDFAQEEADVQQINFTRFSLFFPEKRQFFLEGQQMFQVGVAREADLIFTRRIGLSSRGEVIPLIGGGRLSGRQGRTTLGVMTIQTDRFGATASQNFTVMRVQRDVFSRSKVGAIVTNVQGGGRFNRVAGADANIFFKDVWAAEGFIARMDEPGRTSGARAAYGRFALDTDRVGASYRYLDLGENFRPGVGFVQRPDSRHHSAVGRYSPRPRLDFVRQLTMTGEFQYVTNQQNVLETRERELTMRSDFESGDAVSAGYTQSLEFIAQPFRLRRDVVILPGTYRFESFGANFNSFRRRHLTLNVGLDTGGFWTGARDTLSIRSGWRINTHVGISGNYEINWIDLPEGTFTTQLVSSRLQTALSNTLAILTLLQYNHDTRQLSTNLRFNWIPKPGTDFFIVYNELDDRTSGLAVRNRSIVVKINYLFAL